LSLAALAAAAAVVAVADDLANRFDDPFFQVADAVPGCPLPAGPFITEREWREEAHRRVEKGTTCWLAGRCERPNAYAYDRDIAAAFQAALRQDDPFADTTLWVTVQGRVVYIEGCAARESAVAEIEAYARRLPYVEQAIAIVRTDPAARPPYRLR
jgi:hypothetical protein